MSKRTKKVGTSGRLGPRYGVRIRKRIADVEAVSKGRHECPKCRVVAMQRKASGIYECKHCGAMMASSSYMPTPPAAIRREIAEVLAKAEDKEAEVEVVEETEELPKEQPEVKEKPKKRVKKAKKE
ncbi:MAG: 50S ribosomal protein L37ae [Euryarchaeota archaeon RBG_13_57_23]|nr:MAG: 50S ribosomal protein L37ae [Euryarchaeota archaeon RBG_13_57_23]